MFPTKNVGIHHIDFYVPSYFIDQSDLENHQGVSVGKYTKGLGQEQMSFCPDYEDINSICLTVMEQLLSKTKVSYSDIGFLEVGTETLVDKSKSVKTVLMELFKESGNFDVLGCDTTNACYGGTNALFHAVDWCYSNSYDGRYALVIAADIAVYAEPSTKPTGGAGAVAMLIKPDAPLVLEPIRSSYSVNAWDFYKPKMDSEYPFVDGKLSIECYLRAVDYCYEGYLRKASKNTNDVGLNSFETISFHTPFNKMIQKALGRLYFKEFQRLDILKDNCILCDFADIDLEDSYKNQALLKEFTNYVMNEETGIYESKVKSTETLAKRCGNMYCASLYGGLCSTLFNREYNVGDRLLCFSYGSGIVATMFSFVVNDDLTDLTKNLNLVHRLDNRIYKTCEEFDQILQKREGNAFKLNFISDFDGLDHLIDGAYYLAEIQNGKRVYSKK
eukprot:TRINITY_DN2245_c0_g2_i1.p1 TRINITY_DN2245_c0_g2~~TRINITY_DN2245_c0_g2_i1.p1  ORF type:complete len:445 (+),score=114.90 TRINITY_DN2245_c0_g2_i1:51-1385(+)